MGVCVCVRSVPRDAMKSQNLQMCFEATIPLPPCPGSCLVGVTWVVPRRGHGRLPGVLRALRGCGCPWHHLHCRCDTCAYSVSVTWPVQLKGGLILKAAEDQGSGLPEPVPPPGRCQGCHTSSQEVVTVGLPSRLPRREVLAGPWAGAGPEAVEVGECLRLEPAGHPSVCGCLLLVGAFRTLTPPLWPQFSYL